MDPSEVPLGRIEAGVVQRTEPCDVQPEKKRPAAGRNLACAGRPVGVLSWEVLPFSRTFLQQKDGRLMIPRLMSASAAALALLAVIGCTDPTGPSSSPTPPASLGAPLFKFEVPPTPPPAGPQRSDNDIIVGSCRIIVVDQLDLPSLRDGVVKQIFVQEGEIITTPDQVLVQLDNRMAIADVRLKEAKVKGSMADAKASEKTRDEMLEQYRTQLSLKGKHATSDEEVRKAQVMHIRYVEEAVSKKEAISLAEEELNQAKIVLDMHQLRNIAKTTPGVVQTIYRKEGWSVKNLEPVLQICKIDRLRVEVMVERQNAVALRKGMTAVIEPARPARPEQLLTDHRQEITSIAVGGDAKHPRILSASEDRTVHVWELTKTRRWQVAQVLRHPTAVQTVAAAPTGNLCLSGAADGKARLWDLASRGDRPVRELAESHRGAVSCCAFAPDGKTCVTGGEDRQIRLWDVATGSLRYTFPDGHRGALTSLQFTPDGHLVSFGRDNTLRYWGVFEHGAREEMPAIPERSGDVGAPGVSPDGTRVLFDLVHGHTLRVLSLPDGVTHGELHNPADTGPFTTFARFSPDGRLILTAGGGLERRMQLWQVPAEGQRGHELLQLTSPRGDAASCCAFAPDSSFVVTGGKDKQVAVWRVPTSEECRKHSQLTGTIRFVAPASESSSKQVRVWVDFDNPLGADGRPLLMPGDTATVSIDPQQNVGE
jgi:WD40 repeat protein